MRNLAELFLEDPQSPSRQLHFQAESFRTDIELKLGDKQIIYQPTLDNYRAALGISSRHNLGEALAGATIAFGSLALGRYSEQPTIRSLSYLTAGAALVHASLNLGRAISKDWLSAKLSGRDSFALIDLELERLE